MIIENHTLLQVEDSDIKNGTFIIPPHITEIGCENGRQVFADCQSLKDISIPEHVTYIGPAAFYKCENLENVCIPDSIQTIHGHTFSWCKNLRHVTIPSSVTTIEYYAFYKCESLESIHIPDSVKTIGISAFNGCKNLKVVEFLKGITYPDDFSLLNCEDWDSIPTHYHATKLDMASFANCRNLTTVIIPNKPIQMGRYTFYESENLKRIQHGKHVYDIQSIDGFCAHVFREKQFGDYTIYKCQYLHQTELTWAARKNGVIASGATLREAIREVNFKLLSTKDISYLIHKIESQNYVTAMDYRLITGACQDGISQFLQKHHLDWESKLPIQKAIEITEGEYGHTVFVNVLTAS